MEKLNNIVVEDARIMFRNFAGRGNEFNREGYRNFCLAIPDPELATTLSEDGWNIKILRPRNDDEDPLNYLQVKVKFGAYPPTVYMVKGRNKILLDEDSVSLLDDAEIENVDLEVRPYNWKIGNGPNAKTGVSAYLKTMYVKIKEDIFSRKYEDAIDEEEYNVPF